MPQKMPFPPVSWTNTGETNLRLALYQPDIPQNAGSLMRLCACLGVAMDILEPCGFLLSDRNFRRAGMDYLNGVDLTRHASWEEFRGQKPGRLVLLPPKASSRYFGFCFSPSEALLVVRESAAVPEDAPNAADVRWRTPMRA